MKPLLPSSELRRTPVLQKAWRAIKENALSSSSKTTRKEARLFDERLSENIRSIQRSLKKGYCFQNALGVEIPKKSGGSRGLVIAPIRDRVVQRAILNTLYQQDAPALRAVLDEPASVGGLPGKGVSDAIREIERTRRQWGRLFVAGSDISGFFTKVQVEPVVDFIRENVEDAEFTELFRRALVVNLSNANLLSPSQLALFPSDGIGIAQGCPLSALAGNIYLREFDTEMNTGDVVCLRYIDDFIVLCRTEAEASKSLNRARLLLADLGLSIYDPSRHPNKAFIGPLSYRIHFLGHALEPEKYPPTQENIDNLIRGISRDADGFFEHVRLLREGRRTSRRQSYAATLSAIDQRVMAWSGAFSAMRCEETAARIDQEIDKQVSRVINQYARFQRQVPRHRLLGVHHVIDDIIISGGAADSEAA